MKIKNVQGTGRARGWPAWWVTALMLAWSGVAAAGGGETLDYGFAFRQISEWQKWPTELVEAGLVPAGQGRVFQELMRLWTNGTFGRVRFRGEVENSVTYASPGLSSGRSGGWADHRSGGTRTFWNLRNSAGTTTRRDISSEIDRFELSWTAGRVDVDLGRQPMSFGTSHFIGVLDVVAPFHPGYLDASYKPGVDGLRLRTGMGTSGEAELIGVLEKPWRNRILLGRFRNSFAGFDVEALAGTFRERGFAGVGFEGEKRKVNLWGELGVFERKPGKETHRGGPSSRAALSWILGMERDLTGNLRAGAAFFHQDFGTARPRDLAGIGADAPFAEGWTYLTGKEYALLTLAREVTPLLKFDVSGMLNLGDASFLVQPKIALNTGDNSDVTFFAWLGTGKRPGSGVPATGVPATGMPVPAAGVPVIRSEFGLFPTGLGLIARWFF